MNVVVMRDTYLFAAANGVLCLAVCFVCLCRMNAMNWHVYFRVRLEYAAYMAGALAAAAKPFWGEWPEWGSIAMVAGLLVGLLCSGRAWRGDKPPASATDQMPLYSRRRRFIP